MEEKAVPYSAHPTPSSKAYRPTLLCKNMTTYIESSLSSVDLDNLPLFEGMARNIFENGYSIHTNALPYELGQLLWAQLQKRPKSKFKKARIGRKNTLHINTHIRTDEISWINGETLAGAAWLNWTASMQSYLNRHLYLGLFSFESHFARYKKGAFYKKHQDAFKGEDNRIVSVVVYFNRDWKAADAGELMLYTGLDEDTPLKVAPEFGTLVVFLSEDFPHEVLATNCERLSIAGWFRVNGSRTGLVDPPQ